MTINKIQNTHLWYDPPEAFNRLGWMQFISQRTQLFAQCHKINLDVIVPWGFELLNDTGYLHKRLRRFYCYYGVDHQTDVDLKQLSMNIGMDLINCIKNSDRVFYQHIVALLSGGDTHLFHDMDYHCQKNDCVIAVVVKKSKDILLDYARYIIGTIDAVAKNTGEISDYMNYVVSRWRLFQLYLMHESLFGTLLPAIPDHLQDLHMHVKKFTKNEVWPFYNHQEAMVPATGIEKDIIERLILPRNMQIRDAMISGGRKFIKDTVESFHRPDQPLHINISDEIYHTTINKIISTYNDFGIN